jgi:hypothetical protein
LETESLANELNEWRLKSTSGTEELQAEEGVPVSPEGFVVSPFAREGVIYDEDMFWPTTSVEHHFDSVNNNDSEDSKAPEAENIELQVEMERSDGNKPGASSNEVALMREQEIRRQLNIGAESVTGGSPCGIDSHRE